MTTYVLHIASGLYFRISAFLSLSILDSKTVHECFIQKKKIMQEQGKQNLESNSITQSFLNESFEAFVD
jgi:hypothetical protein